MRFKNLNNDKIIDIDCDCGCSSLRPMTGDEEIKTFHFKSMNCTTKYVCRDCSYIFELPMLYMEVKDGN